MLVEYIATPLYTTLLKQRCEITPLIRCHITPFAKRCYVTPPLNFQTPHGCCVILHRLINCITLTAVLPKHLMGVMYYVIRARKISCNKTHSSVSTAKKTKEDMRHTNVLFTGTVKLPNSAFCISKTTIPISTKFTYFLPYIYTTSHIKIEGDSFSSSRDICS